jgi:hypothetical protein
MGTAKQSPIKQRCMIELVLEHIVLFACQAGNDADISHITAGKYQCTTSTGEYSQIFFQRVMGSTVTRHQMRATTSGTVVIKPFFKRRNHIGMCSKP